MLVAGRAFALLMSVALFCALHRPAMADDCRDQLDNVLDRVRASRIELQTASDENVCAAAAKWQRTIELSAAVYERCFKGAKRAEFLRENRASMKQSREILAFCELL